MTKYSLRARMMILILAPTLMIGLLLSTFFIVHRYNELQRQLVDAGINIIEPLAVSSEYGMTFHSKEAVLRLLDQMAAVKLNKFHFHLSDDEGWRIEIPGLPELTDIGARRCHDLTEQRCLLPQLGSGPFADAQGNGYLTRDDYIAILRYAKARGIEVIPEIDMPAHARAAVISMEARYNRLMKEGKTKEANEYRLVDPTDTSNTTSVQFYDRTSYLNPCLDSSMRFVDKVISEIQAMHQAAGAPLTGGKP